jgi:hypothetical protein
MRRAGRTGHGGRGDDREELRRVAGLDERAGRAVQDRDGPERQRGKRKGADSDSLGDDAEVTAVVAATVGALQFCVVTMLALAVNFTDLTEVALDATVIWACRTTSCFTETELTVHAAVPSLLAQPLVNVAFWLVGCAVSATDTSEAGVFRVEIRTM